jgi:FMN-dependent NADH-azoreductase
MKLLHIDSSILGANGATRTVTQAVVDHWKTAVPSLEIQHLDLAEAPLPHLSGASLARVDDLEAARDARTLSDFLSADVVVIGAPMYNFTIPTQLKSWIDRVMVAGKTFRYGPTGPEGLAGDKRVVVAVASGGVHPLGSPSEHVESYLRFVFGFIGIRDVTVLRAEGLAISPESRHIGLSAALSGIPAISPLPLAA